MEEYECLRILDEKGFGFLKPYYIFMDLAPEEEELLDLAFVWQYVEQFEKAQKEGKAETAMNIGLKIINHYLEIDKVERGGRDFLYVGLAKYLAREGHYIGTTFVEVFQQRAPDLIFEDD